MLRNSKSFDEILSALDGQSYDLEIRRLEIKRRRITEELERLNMEYTEIVTDAASIDERRRKERVLKAKALKKEWLTQKEIKKQNSADLATIIFVGAARELIDRCDRGTTDIDMILDDPDINSDDVIASVWDSMSKYDLDHRIVAEIQDELGLDLIDIEPEPEPWYPPIPEDTQIDFDDIDIKVDAESNSLEDFEYTDLDLDSDGQ